MAQSHIVLWASARSSSGAPARCAVQWSLSHPGPVPWYLLSVRRGLHCSADFQPAVTPNYVRQNVESIPRVGLGQHLTECNSAIQRATQLPLWEEGEPVFPRRSIQTARLSTARCALFPRPAGEGQGEGKQRERRSPVWDRSRNSNWTGPPAEPGCFLK